MGLCFRCLINAKLQPEENVEKKAKRAAKGCIKSGNCDRCKAKQDGVLGWTLEVDAKGFPKKLISTTGKIVVVNPDGQAIIEFL